MSADPDSDGLGASAAVVLNEVTKAYGSVLAVDRVSLEVPSEQFVSLLGPSGCGKTTCLRLIAGFETPTSGRVRIQGQDVTRAPPYRRDLGMVFQSYALFPHLTVAENVEFGLKMRRKPRRERRELVERTLQLVKLGALGDRYPKQLSGGQQQRVALARAIVFRPAVLLLDESLAALDKSLREEMQSELRNLQKQLGVTAVFVTHDQEEALTMSDLVVVMNHGRIEQIGSPRDVYERPDTEFVARFLGASNIVDARVLEVHSGIARLDVLGRHVKVRTSYAAAGRPLFVSLRPERVALAPSGSANPGAFRVSDILYRGIYRQVAMSRADNLALVAIVGNTGEAGAVEPGNWVTPVFDEASVVPLRPDHASVG